MTATEKNDAEHAMRRRIATLEKMGGRVIVTNIDEMRALLSALDDARAAAEQGKEDWRRMNWLARMGVASLANEYGETTLGRSYYAGEISLREAVDLASSPVAVRETTDNG